MQVNSTDLMQQMQTQTRAMDGSGQGKGKGAGMKDIMQTLSTNDRAAVQEQMISMSPEDRAMMISQMKQVDSTSMSNEDYVKTLLDMLNQPTASATQTNSFSVYA